MKKELLPLSRKKFISWGLGVSSLFAVPAFLHFRKKKKEPLTVKMLTQDGKLVMIDISNIPEKKKRIKPADILTWVNRKKAAL